MEKISKEELIRRTCASIPYPLGDQALLDFLDFLEKWQAQFPSAARLRVLCELQKVDYDGHELVIFDQEKIQRAFREMSQDLPEEFYAFTFGPQE